MSLVAGWMWFGVPLMFPGRVRASSRLPPMLSTCTSPVMMVLGARSGMAAARPTAAGTAGVRTPRRWRRPASGPWPERSGPLALPAPPAGRLAAMFSFVSSRNLLASTAVLAACSLGMAACGGSSEERADTTTSEPGGVIAAAGKPPSCFPDCAGADLTGQDLSATKLSGGNFQGANLSKANLTGASLTDANIVNATWDGTQLQGADLTGAKNTGPNPDKLNRAGMNSSTRCPNGNAPRSYTNSNGNKTGLQCYKPGT
ncbi:MAG: pentapeptide repeat-containing protein [Acidobacteria bacterium]|nr:pentapeptide repeat-containing protein [Acidobacteriota bacterium]